MCHAPFEKLTNIQDLSGYEILLIAGNRDPIVSVQESKKVIMLEQAGARVALELFDCGHHLTEEGVGTIKSWLSKS